MTVLLPGDGLATEILPDRWGADEYPTSITHPTGGARSFGDEVGRVLDDFARFDFEFVGINEREATAIDRVTPSRRPPQS